MGRRVGPHELVELLTAKMHALADRLHGRAPKLWVNPAIRIDLGEDRLGDQEDELVGAPGFVKARRQALGAGEDAP